MSAHTTASLVELGLPESPPQFGHAMRKFWEFDSTYVNLNHGSYGSLPLPVRKACDRLSQQIEGSPDRFLRLRYQPLLVKVRQRVAKLIHAETDECVIVSGASLAVNVVLRNFIWNKDDIIIGFSTTYGAVSKTIQYLSDLPPHPTIANFQIDHPTTHAAVISRFREQLRALPPHCSPTRHNSNPVGTQNERKVVALIDTISSAPGAYLPWQELVEICREEGVWSVVDGAHSIGQELDINLSKTKPDFWVSNCHKWLYAKRACAVIYVPFRNQHMIKSAIPTPSTYQTPPDMPKKLSTTFTSEFVTQFEWTGTIDFVPWLSVTAALDFRDWLGGEKKINEYCHTLAATGGKRLAEILGTSVMGETAITLSMVNVELPIPGTIAWTSDIDEILRQRMLLEWEVAAAWYYHNGKWWTRVSAQVFNEISDFEYLGRAFASVCKEIRVKYGSETKL